MLCLDVRHVYLYRSASFSMITTCCSWLVRLPARWPIDLCQGSLQGRLCQQLRGPRASHLCQHGGCGIDLHQDTSQHPLVVDA